MLSQIDFRQDDVYYKGSQLRCLLLTGLEKDQFRQQLLTIINHEKVDGLNVDIQKNFEYYPKGLINPEEIQIDKKRIPISEKTDYCSELYDWWLADQKYSTRTPVWDIACTAKINDKPGFILVEAKAHYHELIKENDDKTGSEVGSANYNQIKDALDAINKLYGYDLQLDHYYQLSNRIAWSLKLASLGIPVILIYLGCLKTSEMTLSSKRDFLFDSHDKWEKCVWEYSKNVKFQCWEQPIQAKRNETAYNNIEPQKVYPIIRSIDIQVLDGSIEIENDITVPS